MTRGKDSDKKILKIENHNGGPLTQATREQGHPSLDRGLVTDQREDRKRERERDRGRDRGDINVFIPEGQMTMDEAIVQGEMLSSKAFFSPVLLRQSVRSKVKPALIQGHSVCEL